MDNYSVNAGTENEVKTDVTYKKSRVIHSQKLAGYLMQRGFVLIGMKKDNKTDSGRNVFFFKNSDYLDAAIGDFIKLKNAQAV